MTQQPAAVAAMRRRYSDLWEALSSGRHPRLSERDETILRMRFGLTDGHARTLDEIAVVFGVTNERIRQIERQTIARWGLDARSTAGARLPDDLIDSHPWFRRRWHGTAHDAASHDYDVYDDGSPVAGAVRSARTDTVWRRTSRDRWSDGTVVGTWHQLADQIGEFQIAAPSDFISDAISNAISDADADCRPVDDDED